MVTLVTALVSLLDEWKRHVGPGVPLDQTIGRIDAALGAQLYEITSDTPTRRIASVIESTLSAYSHAAVDAADDLAEQYGTKRSLLAETTLETFLSEIWPKTPPKPRLSRSGRAKATSSPALRSMQIG